MVLRLFPLLLAHNVRWLRAVAVQVLVAVEMEFLASVKRVFAT
jgi:hypothetical protein